MARVCRSVAHLPLWLAGPFQNNDVEFHVVDALLDTVYGVQCTDASTLMIYTCSTARSGGSECRSRVRMYTSACLGYLDRSALLIYTYSTARSDGVPWVGLHY